MIITISGKQMEVTDSLKEVINEKCTKLDKYFHKDTPITITLSSQKERQIVEATIPFSGTIIRAEEATPDMYASIDSVISILERQIRKHKTKLQQRNKASDTIRFENIVPQDTSDENEDSEESKIVRTKRFTLKPMDKEEAVLQMDLLRHNFFVYMDGETGETNVVYKRKDGNYGLIEPIY